MRRDRSNRSTIRNEANFKPSFIPWLSDIMKTHGFIWFVPPDRDGQTWREVLYDAPLFLGPELHIEGNAASINNEQDATTGFISNLSTMTSDNDVAFNSNYSIKYIATGSAGRIDYDLDAKLTIGKSYRLQCDVRHIGSGATQALYLSAGGSSTTQLLLAINNTETTFQHLDIVFTHSVDSVIFLAREVGADDGGLYIDNFSIKEVGVSLGSDIVVNGGFDDGSNWTTSGVVTIAAGVATFVQAGGGADLFQNALLDYVDYAVSFDITEYTSGVVTCWAGVTQTSISNDTVSGVGSHTITFSSGDTNGNLIFSGLAANKFNGKIDNVVVRPLETQGRELFVKDFTAGLWATAGSCVIDDLDSFTTTAIAGVHADDAAITTGKTYTIRVKGTTTASSITIRNFAGTKLYGTIGTGAFDETFTFTGDGDGIYFRNESAGTTDIDWTNTTIHQIGIEGSNVFPKDELLDESGAHGTATAASFDALNDADLGNIIANRLRITRTITNNPAARQSVSIAGDRLVVTGGVRSGGGSAQPNFADNSGGSKFFGTTSTKRQPLSFEFVNTGANVHLFSSNAAAGEYTEWEDLSIRKANPLNVPIIGAEVAQPADGNLGYADLFDGSNDYIPIHSAELNSLFNPKQGTLVAFVRIPDADVWIDGQFRRIVYLQADTNNRIFIDKMDVDNRIRFQYTSGGVSRTVNFLGIATTDWTMLTITWDADPLVDEIRAYVNAAQLGTTLGGLGTWEGNLDPAATFIGADAAANNPWKGLIGYVGLANRALTPVEISEMFHRSGLSRSFLATALGAFSDAFSDAFDN